MRRPTLLLLALLGPVLALAEPCPDPAESSGMPWSTVAANCINEMAALERKMRRFEAGEVSGADRETMDDALHRYDELAEKLGPLLEALRARVRQERINAAQSGTQVAEWRLLTIFERGVDKFKSPDVRVLRDKVEVAIDQEDEHDNRGEPALKEPVTAPAPTQPERDAAIARATAAEQRLPEMTAPAQAVRVAKDFLRGDDPAGAVRVLDRVGKDGGEDSKLLAVRSAARFQTRDWSGAYEDAHRALTLDPSDPRAAELAGAARMMLRRLGLKEPRLAGPKRPPQEDLAEQPAGAWGAAEGAGVETVPRDGRESVAKFWASGRSKLHIGDRRGALLDFARVLERDPRHLGALVQRAYLLNRGPKPDPAAALAETERALAVAPADPAALRERAFALVGLGRHEEALESAEAALKAEPNSALGHLYRAMALQGLGRREEALSAFKRAAELDATLREYYDEALGGPQARVDGGGVALPVVGRKEARLVLLVLGAALALWALWKGGRLAAGRTTRGEAPARPPPAVGTLAPGTVLAGLYRVGGVLGRGGMGVVYEAVDVGLERPVAVKELRAPDEGGELFLREARLVAGLQHPGIVQIHALAEHEGRLYMVFERVAGRSLDAELAERGRLDPQAVRVLLRDVCRALEYAHAAKVIHRDLKPSNLMRAADGRCKVMDFGIAHRASRAGAATRTEAWGTPPYMAPEQEEGRVSPESDLYALGCTVYELLSGARPFSGAADKLALRFRAPSELGLPGALDAFMQRALCPDPAGRFRTAGEFLSAFEASLADRAAA